MSAIIGFIGIGLGSPGNPHILARYMSIDDPNKLKFSAIIGTAWNVLMGVGALLIGLAGRVFFPTKSLLLNEDPENIFPLLAQEHLSPIVFGIIIASIFAAIMSTADSQLLVGASSVVRDIWQKFLNRDKDIPVKKLVLMSRLTVIILVILALILGYLATDLVFWLVLFAWGGLGAALGPTSILALFWKKTTKAGIYGGLITGTVVIIIWNQVDVLKSMIYELVPAFILSLFATWLISLLTIKKES